MVEPIILPVVRIERPGREDAVRPQELPAAVTDINAFRYRRERKAAERRDLTSLLPPCDSEAT